MKLKFIILLVLFTSFIMEGNAECVSECNQRLTNETAQHTVSLGLNYLVLKSHPKKKKKKTTHKKKKKKTVHKKKKKPARKKKKKKPAHKSKRKKK